MNKISQIIKNQMHWPGIEPGPPAWQASILPLNHQCLLVNDFKKFELILIYLCYFNIKNIRMDKNNLLFNFMNLFCLKRAPPEGIEPSTYGLEVHRAIHCAMGAYF